MSKYIFNNVKDVERLRSIIDRNGLGVLLLHLLCLFNRYSCVICVICLCPFLHSLSIYGVIMVLLML